MFVSAALFGDGAAAIVLRRAAAATKCAENPGPRALANGEHFWPGTERIMGWDMKGDGFGVVLSPELPNLIRTRFGEALHELPRRRRAWASTISTASCSIPAAARCWRRPAACSACLPHDLRHSWKVLRDFGNMSSATALFVLAEAMRTGARGRHLLAAFGPGFSAYFMVLEL